MIKTGYCRVCNTPSQNHKLFWEEDIPSNPSSPEIIEFAGELWILCTVFRFFSLRGYGIPITDADPELVKNLQKNTMTSDEFAELYE